MVSGWVVLFEMHFTMFFSAWRILMSNEFIRKMVIPRNLSKMLILGNSEVDQDRCLLLLSLFFYVGR